MIFYLSKKLRLILDYVLTLQYKSNITAIYSEKINTLSYVDNVLKKSLVMFILHNKKSKYTPN